ncbi:MAG TPA: glycosyltransferase family 1 protein [Clostridia bacterium]|nr:glycosyltransferase family 1 protein [Clostridia bacterium]
MKVAIDIRRVADFGVATYIRNVVRSLGRLDHRNEYFLIGMVERLREIGDLPPNFHSIPVASSQGALKSYFEFRRHVKHHGCQLVHVPHTFWRPTPGDCPYVITVHDLLDYMYRVNSRSAMGQMMHFYLTSLVMKKAARIFAVSHFTGKDVSRVFQVPEKKIEVVYNAIDDRFRQGHTTDADREMIAERYQVNYPFLLYAGRISPHKNVVRIIEAFSALKTDLAKDARCPNLKLIIIGDELSKHPDLRRAVIKSGVQNDVRFLGFVPIDVLRIFYDAAKIFVFPSLYEGFGLPPLEAMAHGTPVVASNTSALPEVTGKAAVLVNPENVFEISRALYRVLLDQSLRERMKIAGLEQAAKFSWDTTVQRMIEVYEEAISRS